MTYSMPARVSEAMAVALALVAAPDRAERVRASRLSDGVLDVIRVAAGDVALADEVAVQAGISRREVEEACLHYAHVVMFHSEADHFQVLGVTPDADEDLMKQHFRWLLKWLHPDRDPEGWVSSYAERVNAAWNLLRRSDRRLAYRSERASVSANEALPLSELVAASPPRALQPEVARLPRVSARLLTMLPAALVGLIVVTAAGLFAAHRAGESMLAREASLASTRQGDADVSPTIAGPEDVDHGLPSASSDSARLDPMVDTTASRAKSGVVDSLTGPPATARALPQPSMPALVAPSSTLEDAKVRDEQPSPRLALAPSPQNSEQAPMPAVSPVANTVVPRPLPVSRPPDAGKQDLPATMDSIVESGQAAEPGAQTQALVSTAREANDRRDPVSSEFNTAMTDRAVARAPEVTAAVATEPQDSLPTIDSGQQSTAVPEVAADQQRAVRELLNRFSDAYRMGDPRALVVLFMPNAVTPYGNLLDFNDGYGEVVARSSRRSLEFLNLTMRPTPGGVEAIGRYEFALGQVRGGAVEATAGDARVLIEFEGGRPLIAALEL
jgi:curved DNA-binding protein CbpA